MTKEVMQQALEALENHEGNYKLGNAGCDRQEAAITAIKEALAQPAQPEQEPVAWVCYGTPGKRDIDFEEADINKLPIGSLLYTSPAPQRPWVGLTDEEIAQGNKESWVTEQAWQSAVWWAEAKLKEKNT